MSMRIKIDESEHWGALVKAGLWCARKYIGLVPGPMFFLSYDAAQMPRSMLHFMLRSQARRGLFTKGERELFAAFVSSLNVCHF